MEVYTTWRKCNKLAIFADDCAVYIEASVPIVVKWPSLSIS